MNADPILRSRSADPTPSTEPRADSRGKTLAEQVADRVRVWLEGPRPGWALVDWLEGYNLPAVGPDEDPYVWLRRGLDALPAELQNRFLVQLAQFIDEQPDVKRPGDRPDQVLYNLLWLCARPGDRDRLGPALKRMYERARRREGLIGQTYRGLDLREMLRLALIANQYDRSLMPVWFRMLGSESEQDEVLPGTEYAGFYGVLAADLPGEPSLEDLGRALSEMVDYLTPRRGIRLKKLNDLFRRVQEYHKAYPRWDVALIEIADENQWRLWAVDWLPRLWIGPEDRGNPYQGRWIVWAPLWRLLYDYARRTGLPSDFEKHLAGSRVVIGSLSPEVYDRFGARIAPAFEQARRDSRVPGNERDERGDLAAWHALRECSAMDWGSDPIIPQVLGQASQDTTREIAAARKCRSAPAPAHA